MLTQREAAAACGVSRTTIRRRCEAGDLPGAVQDPVRGRVISVDDLLAAGLRLHAPSPPDKKASAAPGAPEQGAAEERARRLCGPSWSVYGTSTPWPSLRPSTGASSPRPKPSTCGSSCRPGASTSRTYSGHSRP
ncbi:helix-turn-helix domain-containing protein [Streptomyces sp. NPDC057580]|uniref:helix-turn-helix domain-containing protein n=1 Tax=Streptomyces sp. NPDC057580 TaxID=3346173 RepID=UPI00367A970D